MPKSDAPSTRPCLVSPPIEVGTRTPRVGAIQPCRARNLADLVLSFYSFTSRVWFGPPKPFCDLYSAHLRVTEGVVPVEQLCADRAGPVRRARAPGGLAPNPLCGSAPHEAGQVFGEKDHEI